MDYDVLLVTGNSAMCRDELEAMEVHGNLPAERIYAASTLEEALDVVKGTVSAGGSIGVIATDLSLGGILTGTKLLGYVRTSGLQIPVIIKSVNLASVYEEAMLGRGAFAYHQKDKPLKDLVGKVQEALARKR